MANIKIKADKKGVIRFPRFTKGDFHTATIEITESMLNTDDSCDSGWSQITGITFLYQHWNSYRLVYRVHKGQIYIGYYCYIHKVSPQVNKTYKSDINDPYTYIKASPGDTITFQVHFGRQTHMILSNITEAERHGNYKHRIVKFLPLPTGYLWPMWYNNPNIKCPSKTDTNYKISWT